MDKSFEVMGLDADFNIVCLFRCFNIQWRRKFYEPGTFSIQIPLEQYEPTVKYIYTKDRPEVGEISQINYIESKKGTRTFALSGYFLENELNRRVCFKKATATNITNAPSWVNQSGKAEDVATAYFDAFKDVKYSYGGNAYESILGIATATSQGRGHDADHEREGEDLGSKIYTILKPSEMSYRVKYDYDTSQKTFECWKGKDLTQTNADGNNPVIFSTRYGNLKNPNIVISDSDYKNCYIVENSYSDNDVDKVNIQANCERLSSDSSDRFIMVSANANHDDYSSETDYITALHTEGHTELITHKSTMSFDFDAVTGSYEYMVDFDLGDKCSLEVQEIGISQDAVLTEIDEVIKKGTWTMTMSFDV